jgi:hypothetical protein
MRTHPLPRVQIKPLNRLGKNIKAQSSVNNEANRTMSVKYSKIWRTLTNFTTGVNALAAYDSYIFTTLENNFAYIHTELYFVDKFLTSVINKRYVP